MKSQGFGSPDLAAITAPNGAKITVARFPGRDDYYIEILSGASAVGKTSDRLTASKTHKSLGFVSVEEYCQFLNTEARDADNFAARDLLHSFTASGMEHVRRSASNGVVTLPTGDKLRVTDQGYVLEDVCKALGVSESEAIEVLRSIKERGF